MAKFDFHLHTTYSDGTLAPEELIRRLHAFGVKVFAVTDHDSMHVHLNSPLTLPPGMTMVAGVEINTKETGETLHVLGFGRKLAQSATFQDKLRLYRGNRRRRAELFIEKLRLLGFDITMDEVLERAQETVGRPAIADTLRDKGIVKSRTEAFTRFLLKGKAAYVPSLGPDVAEAIEAVVQAGGVAVLAHPGVARINDERLSSLVALGLGGIEAHYPMHSSNQTRDYLSAARKHGLFATCGSDFHGPLSGHDEFVAFDFEERMFAKFLEAVA
ncbi:MAG: PHP domain-containing protein [Elusimicrobia bacterium]|nr:PHP domain-containing protein [Elusimicrobiota bacterium]